jgi:hypothetical protein
MVTCSFCGTVFQVSVAGEESQDGRLILNADFATPHAPGWSVHNADKLTFKPGELWAAFPASDRIHPVLSTPGHYDDLDMAVTVRFLEGSYKHIYAGLELRFNDGGDYSFHVSAQGTYRVAWHDKREWGGALVDWTAHPAMSQEMGARHRLRVVLRGDRMRVFLNGGLATSLRDTRFTAGSARVVISPTEKGKAVVAYSGVELREVV